MQRPLTSPLYVQGAIVEETQGGPDTCKNTFQYEDLDENRKWNGVCAYLEIYNPGIYTFATPCKCNSITDAPADLNERVCIWQGERCGGNVVVQDASPPPPSISPLPPNTVSWYKPPPPLPWPPGMAPPPSASETLGGGGIAAIVLGVTGCLALIAACGYLASSQAARPRASVARVASFLQIPSLPLLPPKPAPLPALTL